MYCGCGRSTSPHRDDNLKFKERLAGFYSVAIDELHKGRLSDDVLLYRRVCPIGAACTAQKGIEGSATGAPTFPAATSRRFLSRRQEGDALCPRPAGAGNRTVDGRGGEALSLSPVRNRHLPRREALPRLRGSRRVGLNAGIGGDGFRPGSGIPFSRHPAGFLL